MYIVLKSEYTNVNLLAEKWLTMFFNEHLYNKIYENCKPKNKIIYWSLQYEHNSNKSNSIIWFYTIVIVSNYARFIFSLGVFHQVR